MRVFITDPVGIQHPGGFADASQLPGRQGRALFALLVAERRGSLTRDVIADRLWGEQLPSSWDGAISALLSKIRRLLDKADPTGTATIKTAFGAHQIQLPSDAWVDLEVARARIDEAEAALRDGVTDKAWAAAHVAWSIATRSFLPGEDAAWADERRRELTDLAVRSLTCMSEVWLGRGEFELAARCAMDIIHRQPFREDARRRLMRAQAGAGNRAQALLTFATWEKLLNDELGIGPDRETLELHDELVAG